MKTLKSKMTIKYSMILTILIFHFSYLPISFSHGMGGSTKSNINKKKMTYNKEDNKGKTISDRMNFRLDIHGNTLKLLVRNRSNQPIDTSLASATVVVTGDGLAAMYNMQSKEEGYIISSIPITVSKNTKFQVTLRMPGERPINITFISAQSAKPISVSQQGIRKY